MSHVSDFLTGLVETLGSEEYRKRINKDLIDGTLAPQLEAKAWELALKYKASDETEIEQLDKLSNDELATLIDQLRSLLQSRPETRFH